MCRNSFTAIVNCPQPFAFTPSSLFLGGQEESRGEHDRDVEDFASGSQLSATGLLQEKGWDERGGQEQTEGRQESRQDGDLGQS